MIDWSKLTWKQRFMLPLFEGDKTKVAERINPIHAFCIACNCSDSHCSSADLVRVLVFLDAASQEFIVNGAGKTKDQLEVLFKQLLEDLPAFESICRNVRKLKEETDLTHESFFESEYGDWYGKYLQTEHWRKMRQLTFDAHGKNCLMCPKPASQVHHRDYSRLGNEDFMRDLTPVCGECHTRFHESTRSLRPCVPPEAVVCVLKESGYIEQLTPEMGLQLS